MTQDELTKLINEFLPYPSKGQHYALRQFATIVVDAEREACATLCDELDKKYWQATGELMSGYGDAIRERGKQ